MAADTIRSYLLLFYTSEVPSAKPSVTSATELTSQDEQSAGLDMSSEEAVPDSDLDLSPNAVHPTGFFLTEQ